MNWYEVVTKAQIRQCWADILEISKKDIEVQALHVGNGSSITLYYYTVAIKIGNILVLTYDECGYNINRITKAIDSTTGEINPCVYKYTDKYVEECLFQFYAKIDDYIPKKKKYTKKEIIGE